MYWKCPICRAKVDHSRPHFSQIDQVTGEDIYMIHASCLFEWLYETYKFIDEASERKEEDRQGLSNFLDQMRLHVTPDMIKA